MWTEWDSLSRWMRFAILFGIWTLFGLCMSAQVHYQTSFYPKPYTWPSALKTELIYTYISAAFAPAILALRRWFPFTRRHLIRNVVVHFLSSIVFGATIKLIWDLFIWPPKAFFLGGVTLQKIGASVSGVLDFGFMLYLVILMVGYAMEYYRRYQAGMVEASQLHTQLAQAQLQTLKMQLHPHFLFNSLHAISALVQEDAQAAERMIAVLSDLLRRSLETSASQESPLEEELQFLDLYLEIEKTRFEDRLTIEFDIDPETRRALAPSLILQPLVENAIRHGVSRMPAGGTVAITAQHRSGNLLLQVRDNGPGMGERPLREGVGLGATRGRLTRLYGGRQRLDLRNLPTGGFEATLTLPYVLSEAEGR